MSAEVEILRAAAEKLRQLAKRATPGPWEIEYAYGGDCPQAIFRMDPEYPDDPDMSEGLGIMDAPRDNAWVATLHPGLAEPLAAWLEAHAGDYELMDCMSAYPLAVARVLLGETS